MLFWFNTGNSTYIWHPIITTLLLLESRNWWVFNFILRYRFFLHSPLQFRLIWVWSNTFSLRILTWCSFLIGILLCHSLLYFRLEHHFWSHFFLYLWCLNWISIKLVEPLKVRLVILLLLNLWFTNSHFRDLNPFWFLHTECLYIDIILIFITVNHSVKLFNRNLLSYCILFTYFWILVWCFLILYYLNFLFSFPIWYTLPDRFI